MGTFFILLLIAVGVVAGGSLTLLPALLVIGAITFAIWLASSIIGLLLHVIGGVLGLAFSLMFGAMGLIFGLVLLPVVFPLLLLAGIIYAVNRNSQRATSQPANRSI